MRAGLTWRGVAGAQLGDNVYHLDSVDVAACVAQATIPNMTVHAATNDSISPPRRQPPVAAIWTQGADLPPASPTLMPAPLWLVAELERECLHVTTQTIYLSSAETMCIVESVRKAALVILRDVNRRLLLDEVSRPQCAPCEARAHAGDDGAACAM
jgi:hypothetical protein